MTFNSRLRGSSGAKFRGDGAELKSRELPSALGADGGGAAYSADHYYEGDGSCYEESGNGGQYEGGGAYTVNQEQDNKYYGK